MTFRRRPSSKPSSSRECNKVRLASKHDVAEIESWVDFVSKNYSDNEEQFSLPSLRKKEESKKLFMMHEKEWRKDMKNHCVNRHLKSNCLQNLGYSLIKLFQDWANKIKI